MSASGPPDHDEQDLARLADVRRAFRQMDDLARETSTCSIPAIQRDSELILALVEQALELLEYIDVEEQPVARVNRRNQRTERCFECQTVTSSGSQR